MIDAPTKFAPLFTRESISSRADPGHHTRNGNVARTSYDAVNENPMQNETQARAMHSVSRKGCGTPVGNALDTLEKESRETLHRDVQRPTLSDQGLGTRENSFPSRRVQLAATRENGK